MTAFNIFQVSLKKYNKNCISKYRVVHEKPARRLVDQRGRRSQTLKEIKQMQMQSIYWLEKVLKMISLYVSALLCTLQFIVIHAMQLSGVNSVSTREILLSLYSDCRFTVEVPSFYTTDNAWSNAHYVS